MLIAACGGVVERDGPGRAIEVERIEEAVPKPEPRSKYGNPESYVVNGKRYYTLETSAGYIERGIASWYGSKFHGRRTSSGEIYDMYRMTAAHKSLPLPTYVEVRNLENNRRATLKVNDRGPFHDNRIIDLSYAAALKLGLADLGTGFVEVRALGPDGRPMAPAVAQPVTREARGERSAPVGLPGPVEAPAGVFMQLGAFQERGNAERLAGEVRRLVGDRVHVRAVTGNGRPIYRVQVGPIVSVESADDLVVMLESLGITQHHFVAN